MNSYREETLRNKIVTICVKNLQNGFFLACFNIFHARHCVLRLFLLTFVLVSATFANYLIISSILDYISYEVTSSSRTIYEEGAHKFPKITFCNVSPFTTGYAVEILKEINRKMYTNVDIFNASQMKELEYANKSALIKEVYAQANIEMLNSNFTDDKRKKLGHAFKDILMS
jgi:glutaredoxin-related protein